MSDSKRTSRSPPAAPDPVSATGGGGAGGGGAGGGAATTAGAGDADRGVVGGEGERRTTSAHERGLAPGEDVEDEEENIWEGADGEALWIFMEV